MRENARLREELRRLRDRVSAFESSRWWHLHPRFLLLNMGCPFRRTERDQPQAAPARDVAEAGPFDVLAERFQQEVLTKATFSSTPLTKLALWEPFVARLENHPASILEIGSYEGFTACYLLWRLPEARLTCVDTFLGGAEHRKRLDFSRLEAAFDANVALVDASRVRKLVGDSRRVLVDLLAEGRRFDLVYVDGSHLALDVLVDASLAWQLLEVEGVIVFDDYTWTLLGADSLLRPGAAIDAFLTVVQEHGELVSRRNQIAARKTSEPQLDNARPS